MTPTGWFVIGCFMAGGVVAMKLHRYGLYLAVRLIAVYFVTWSDAIEIYRERRGKVLKEAGWKDPAAVAVPIPAPKRRRREIEARPPRETPRLVRLLEWAFERRA